VKVSSLQKVICGEYQKHDQDQEDAGELKEILFHRMFLTFSKKFPGTLVEGQNS